MVLSELQDGRSLMANLAHPQPEDDEPAESKDGNSSRGTRQEGKAEETEYELNLAFSVLQCEAQRRVQLYERAESYNAVVLKVKYIYYNKTLYGNKFLIELSFAVVPH